MKGPPRCKEQEGTWGIWLSAGRHESSCFAIGGATMHFCQLSHGAALHLAPSGSQGQPLPRTLPPAGDNKPRWDKVHYIGFA